jgi:uncharacterized surface protein with fasciclin (FAS1) repeats
MSLKKCNWTAAALFICLATCYVLCAHAQGDTTIMEVLRNQTRFSDFTRSVDAVETLRARLSNATVESTVFAPVNQSTGFNLTETQVAYHLVDGRYLAANLSDGELVPSLLKLATLNNRAQQLKVSIGANATVIAINGVQVKQADIAATNGVVHALASVLSLPGPLATALDGYPTLKSLIAAANITLPAASTVFAPAETAFTNLRIHNPALFGYLAHGTNESRTDLEMVLRYHALPEVLYAQDITVGSRAYNTLAGQSVTISKAVVNNSIEVTLSSNSTSARVESVNTLASDGVLHAIDSVLVPNSFAFTVKKILVGLNDTTLLQLLDQANLTTCLSENCQYTIFAPSQEAWGKADKSDYSRTTELLASILKSHIYPHPLVALSQNMSLTMLNNKTVHIANNSLTLEGEARLGSARVMGNVTVGSNGYVYAIDQVLGVPLASDDSLSKKTIGWIIVGGMGGILLLAAVVVAVVWYVKRKRADSYEVINGSV